MTGVGQQDRSELVARHGRLLFTPHLDEFTVNQGKDASRLELVIGPNSTSPNDRFRPHFEGFPGLEGRLIARRLILIRLAGPLDLANLALSQEDDEVLSSLGGKRDEQKTRDGILCSGQHEVGEISGNVVRRFESTAMSNAARTGDGRSSLEADDSQVFCNSKHSGSLLVAGRQYRA